MNNKLAEQFNTREDYFNNILGVLAFSFALGSLGTNSPSINATISLLFIITLMKFGPFPPLVNMLRSKDNRTQSEENTRITIESKNLGIHAILTRYTICVLGCLALAFVISSNTLGNYFPIIKHYIQG